MDKVRLGIIGLGAQGGSYAAFLSGKPLFPGMPAPAPTQHIALAAICDVDPAKKAMAAQKYPETPFFDDYKGMIDSGAVDAVVTTVPHYFHPEMAIYAMSKGVHVMVEKPAGVYAKDVRRMNEFATRHPEITFAIMFNQRTNKLYQQLKRIIGSGELGEIRRTNWIINSWWRPDSYYKQSEWRATWGGEGGGVLVNQAPHQLDLWQWICGMPVSMSAHVRFGAHRDIIVDNDVTAVCTYANGGTGTFITSTHDVAGTDRLEIDLDMGKIVVEDSKKATVMRFVKSEDEINTSMTMQEVMRMTMSNASGNSLYTSEVIENTDGWGVQHMTVLENFGNHIKTGEPLIAPGSDGIRGVQLANAIMLSGWLGKTVDVPVDEDAYLAELNKHIEQEGKYPTR